MLFVILPTNHAGCGPPSGPRVAAARDRVENDVGVAQDPQ